MTVRVICRATIAPEQQHAFEQAYLQVTENLDGTPGRLNDELLRGEDGTTYLLIAEWSSEEVFRAWADDPRHIEESAPMFPYWADTFERQIYELRAKPDLDNAGRAAPDSRR